jgi:hypothetical protein
MTQRWKRHLARPSVRGQAFCGTTSWYRYDMMREIKDVNCPECLAKIEEMHNGQART